MTALNFVRAASLCGLACLSVVASPRGATAAEFKALDEAALRSAVSGKTVRLDTKIGSIPINFRPDGTMTGRSQDLANYLGRSYDTGTWWIDSDKLCQKWKMWMEGQSFCFTIRQSGQQVHWTRDDGLKGTISVSN